MRMADFKNNRLFEEFGNVGNRQAKRRDFDEEEE